MNVRICKEKNTINDTTLFKCHVSLPPTLKVIPMYITRKMKSSNLCFQRERNGYIVQFHI